MPLCTHTNEELMYPSNNVSPINVNLSENIKTYKKILDPFKSNYKINSISHYKKSATF